ncbi:unnamed protein product [Urochloa humidicola]
MCEKQKALTEVESRYRCQELRGPRGLARTDFSKPPLNLGVIQAVRMQQWRRPPESVAPDILDLCDFISSSTEEQPICCANFSHVFKYIWPHARQVNSLVLI